MLGMLFKRLLFVIPSLIGVVIVTFLLTRALPSEEAVRDTFRAFVQHGVAFTIATDGPEMMRTHLRDEFDLLERIGALDTEELAEANRRGHEASFVRAQPVLPRA